MAQRRQFPIQHRYDARLVDSDGAQKNGIEKVKDKMVGRGVLLDIARHIGVDSLDEGIAITNEDLDACAEAQGVEVRRGDFVLCRTGMIEQRLRDGEWGGYAGGDAPGLAFETAEWIHGHEIAAICCDTWGCEVRPNETTEAQQPWHWVVIPMIGISMGEIFNMGELAEDCADDVGAVHYPVGGDSGANHVLATVGIFVHCYSSCVCGPGLPRRMQLR